VVVERKAVIGCQERFILERNGSYTGDTSNFFWVNHNHLWPFAIVPFIVNILTHTITHSLSAPPPSELALAPNDISAFKRGFQVVRQVRYERQYGGMPESKTEWEPIMRFWSERLERRVEGEIGLYEVVSGSE